MSQSNPSAPSLPADGPVAGAAKPPKAKKKPLRMKKHLKKIIVAVVILALAGSGAAYGLTRLFAEEELVIRTGATGYGSLATPLSRSATTMPGESDTYPVMAEAEVLTVNVSAGDTVQVGDLLYTQDDTVIDEEIDGYQEQIESYQETVDDCAQQLADLQEDMDALTITAGLSGHLYDVTVKSGDEVKAGDVLAHIYDDDTMVLKTYFSYLYEDQISLGMAATVSLADQMLSLSGTVTAIDKVDYVTAQGTRCFAVTISVENPGSLADGQTAAATLTAADGSTLYPAGDSTLTYSDSATLTAQGSGTLVYVNAQDYQNVSAGQTLFVIGDDAYTDQMENLQKQSATAQEHIADLQERIAEAEEDRSDYAVYAELAGTVMSVNIQEGRTYPQSQTAVSIYSLDTMSLSISIDELYIDQVSEGMEVTVVREGSEQNQSYTGTVTELGLEATASSGVATFPATVTVESGGVLSAGVYVSWYIALGGQDDEEGILCPIDAIQTINEENYVFVQGDPTADAVTFSEEDGVDIPDGFYAVAVELGSYDAAQVHILSGLDQEGLTVFLGYQQAAPEDNGASDISGGDEESGFPGGMPDMGNLPDMGGGNMPNMGGGGMSNMGGGGRPGGMG